MDRLERLVNLVAALIDTPRPLAREEVRQRIEGYSDDPDAFRRNFERDKDLLRQMVRIRSVVGEDTTAHLWVSDLAGHMREERRVTLQHIADLKVAVAGQGPDGDVAVVLPDIGQLGQPADVDEHGGRRQAQPHRSD